MFRKLAREEKGMTMGLAVITMALMGVMGAGVLVFVATDLNSVVEYNQGQKAFELADSGVQIAKKQIGSDSRPSSYTDSGEHADWSPTNSASTSGKTITVDGNSIRVTIEHNASNTSIPMFKVISEGTVGEARRKVEAFISSPQWGVQAYFTPGDIYIDKDTQADEPAFYKLIDRVDIRGVSLFAGRDVIIGDNWGMSERGNNVWGYGNGGSNRFRAGVDSLINEPTKPSYWENQGLPQPHIRIVGNAACPELREYWATEDSAFDSATSPGFQTDVLGDWYKPPYNTVRRASDDTRYCEDGRLEDEDEDYYAGDGDINPDPYPDASLDNDFRRYHTANIAAEGMICRATDYSGEDGTPVGCDSSIAGVNPGDALGGSARRLGYDSTTLNDASVPGFYKKSGGFTVDAPMGRENDLTYPFNPEVPDVEALKDMAEGQPRDGGGTRYVDLDAEMNFLGAANNSVTGWRKLYPNGNEDTETVVFIDAGGRSLELPKDNLDINGDDTFPRQGILVVRCGNLTNLEEFQGLIILLNDTGPGDADSTCAEKGNYRAGKPGLDWGADPDNLGGEIDVNGYVFAEGDGDATPGSVYKYGIYIADGANVDRLDPLHRGLPAIVGGGGAGGRIESWRECYNDSIDDSGNFVTTC